MQRGEFHLRRVDDRTPFLQRRRRPLFVLEPHAAVAAHLDDGCVHRPHVEFHTPAAAAARRASSTPTTTAAIGAPSVAPPYAYSTFTPASATSRSAGASEPGPFGTDSTITSRTAT